MASRRLNQDLPVIARFSAESGSLALTISIDGAIGPASASYVKDALARAGERRAEIVILRLNTPGGLNTSMREIITDVLASPVPVIGYVAPSGAHLPKIRRVRYHRVRFGVRRTSDSGH